VPRARVNPHPSVDLVRQLNITWLDKPYYNGCDCPLTLAIVKLIDYQIISYKDRPQVESRLYRVDNLEPADPSFTVGRFSDVKLTHLSFISWYVAVYFN
jgi:hypothetical protein